VCNVQSLRSVIQTVVVVCPSFRTAETGEERVRVKFSVFSATWSSVMGMWTVAILSPGSKVTTCGVRQ